MKNSGKYLQRLNKTNFPGNLACTCLGNASCQGHMRFTGCSRSNGGLLAKTKLVIVSSFASVDRSYCGAIYAAPPSLPSVKTLGFINIIFCSPSTHSWWRNPNDYFLLVTIFFSNSVWVRCGVRLIVNCFLVTSLPCAFSWGFFPPIAHLIDGWSLLGSWRSEIIVGASSFAYRLKHESALTHISLNW